jgi:hypothetical protein
MGLAKGIVGYLQLPEEKDHADWGELDAEAVRGDEEAQTPVPGLKGILEQPPTVLGVPVILH